MSNEQPIMPPSVAELQQWYSPKDALARAAQALGDAFAAEGIWNRIRAEIIRIACHSASEQKGSEPVVPYRTPQVLRAWLFRTHKDLPEKFWSGDFNFGYDEPPPEAANMPYAEILANAEIRYKFKFVYVEAFGVRFNPEDIDREFPEPRSAQSTESESLDQPRATDPHLAIWREAYGKVYGDNLALPHAVQSAKGFLHDKSVARDRVHALFSGRMAGRKPGSSGD